MECSSALAAELEALVWASEIVAGEGWSDLVWSSDAANLIREVTSNADPENWSTRPGVLQIKDTSSRHNCNFFWNSRSSNRAADLVAKFTLGKNFCFYFDSSSVEPLMSLMSFSWTFQREWFCNHCLRLFVVI